MMRDGGEVSPTPRHLVSNRLASVRNLWMWAKHLSQILIGTSTMFVTKQNPAIGEWRNRVKRLPL